MLISLIIRRRKANSILSVALRQYLPDIVSSPACKILHISALPIKIREYNDLLFIKLAQIFGNYNVVMGICVIKLNNVVISSEVVGDFALKRSTRKASPKLFSSLHHYLVRFRYSTIEIKISSNFCICFQFTCKLFFIVLFELLFYNTNHCRDFFILTASQHLVHFFVSVVASVKIDKAFKCSILLLTFESLLSLTFLATVGNLFKHKRENICCRN